MGIPDKKMDNALHVPACILALLLRDRQNQNGRRSCMLGECGKTFLVQLAVCETIKHDQCQVNHQKGNAECDGLEQTNPFPGPEEPREVHPTSEGLATAFVCEGKIKAVWWFRSVMIRIAITRHLIMYYMASVIE